MRDILPQIQNALEAQRPFAWARVIDTWGSAPRRPGGSMIVLSPDEYEGSVSGGCVEHAVVDEALGTLVTGRSQVLEYGVRDETAWSAGLSCGGQLRVLVERFPAFEDNATSRTVARLLLNAVASDHGVVLATLLPDDSITTGGPVLLDADGARMAGGDPPRELRERAPEILRRARPSEVETDEGTWFLHPFPPRDRLFIIGGSDIAVRLIPLARAVDFETFVIDPRRVLADGRRFSDPPDHLSTESAAQAFDRTGLTASTYAVLLTHDPSIDDPALDQLLRSDAAYIGALGGRRTQEKRADRLAKAGFSKQQIARIDGPVGLPIGAVTPSEIALSIAARLVEVRRSRSS